MIPTMNAAPVGPNSYPNSMHSGPNISLVNSSVHPANAITILVALVLGTFVLTLVLLGIFWMKRFVFGHFRESASKAIFVLLLEL